MKPITDHQFYEMKVEFANNMQNVPVVERLRALATSERERRVQARTALDAHLYVRDPDGLNDRFREDEGLHAAADIETLNNGAWRSGYWDASLKPFASGPGIHAIEQFIKWCDDALAAVAQRQAATYPAPHRFKGSRGPHVVDGRVLKVGDVVTLTAAQPEAWSDRFERIEQEQATTKHRSDPSRGLLRCGVPATGVHGSAGRIRSQGAPQGDVLTTSGGSELPHRPSP